MYFTAINKLKLMFKPTLRFRLDILFEVPAVSSHLKLECVVDSEKNNITGRNASRYNKSEIVGTTMWCTFWGYQK